MKKKFLIWTTGMFLILLYMISLYSIHRNASLALMQMMIFLTFPSGLVVFDYFGGIFYVPLGNEIVSELVLPWLGFTVFGFFQWFVLLPMIIKLFHRQISLLKLMFKQKEEQKATLGISEVVDKSLSPVEEYVSDIVREVCGTDIEEIAEEQPLPLGAKYVDIPLSLKKETQEK